MIEIDDGMAYERRCALLLDALASGVGDAILPLHPSAELIVASGSWGEYGSVLVFRLDEDDEEVMLFDSYVVERAADGDWVCPQSSSGSALPIAVLERAEHGLPDWQGTEMAFFGSAFRAVGGVPVASLSVMFSRAVATARIRHGDDALTLAVPDSGFITVPVRVLSPQDFFRVETTGPQGDLIEERSFHFVPDDVTLIAGPFPEVVFQEP